MSRTGQTDMTNPSASIDSYIGEPEREDLEFKSGLEGSKSGDKDPWYVDQSKIGDRAKYALFREIVAFANRNGGTLVLGIEEDDNHPHVGKSLSTLPAVHDLADRLRRSAHGSIEPPLRSLEVIGVETETDGAGLVIFNVGRSSVAPHLLNMRDFPKECFIRRNDETLPMDMRAIQDLVLERATFGRTIDDVFRERQISFKEFCEASDSRFETQFHAQDNRAAYPRRCGAFRLTCIPLERVEIPDIARNDKFKLPFPKIEEAESRKGVTYPHRLTVSDYRPVLRGWVAKSDRNHHLNIERIVKSSGLIEDRCVVCPRDWNQYRHLYFEWLLAAVSSIVLAVDEFKAVANLSGTEYALEFALRLPPAWGIKLGKDQDFGDEIYPTEVEELVFDRYALSTVDRYSELLDLWQHDLWNCLGLQNRAPIKIALR